MKPIIINVSLNDKFNIFSYPIFIGNGLLSNCEEILKELDYSEKEINVFIKEKIISKYK